MNGVAKEDYNECHGYKKSDLVKIYGNSKNLGPHEVCNDDYLLLEFEHLEIVYSFHGAGKQYYNESNFNIMITNEQSYLCDFPIKELHIPQKFFAFTSIVEVNKKQKQNKTKKKIK